MNKKRGLRRSQLIATGIAALLTLTFLITLVASPANTTTHTTAVPDSNSSNNSSTFNPAAASENFENDVPFVHPSGIFQSYRPANIGWRQLSASATPAQTERGQVVEVRFQGNSNCAVIHILTEVGADYESIEDLDSTMNDTHFADAWGQYGAWEERSREVVGNQIITEFNLRQPTSIDSRCPDNYRARVISWLSSGIAHHVRMVVRSNDTASLETLEQALVPGLITYPNNTVVLGSNWRTQIDTNQTYFFLTPSGWSRDGSLSTTDRAVYAGVLASEDFSVAVERVEDQVFDNPDDAQTWLTSFIPSDAELLSTETVQQPYASGYQISYMFTNSEGVTTSAIATLLNDVDGVLYFADLRGDGIEMDLLAPDMDTDGINQSAINNAINMSQTFTVMLASF